METKDILKKVKKIEIKTKRLSDHIFSGEYHTSFKGRGMTFSEVRQYQFGDDVRAIDWNVTARYNEPYIKVFEEERELTLMLMVDVSGSENFGSTDTFKNEIVTEIAATLAFSATQNNDKIGLVLFSDQIELFIPPKKGKTHVLRIIRELLDFKPKSQQTNVSLALEYLTKVLKKKAIVFVLSDYITPDFESTLRISAKKHDITGIRVFDKRERLIPNVGLISVLDAETKEETLLDTSSKTVRDEYKAYFDKKEQKFFKVFQKCGAGTINIEVNDSYVKKLLGYFKSR
ncbi:DUF58 domain-containing protein [Myroides pelagicus]|uniref:DUF58 domain-containing protein n=1 Tax=Myroides pelagicus TaxID=270914 RepID=A0A7K1GKP1_9FLAO|nr:DUF58 domain-containing protein [Myroides pelagicus]MEC4113219.1 DUF58 domain-containing protein [Myroides pelagicus]MTH29386.1 DUF58 domain-containing protein [Myroides pelagicus]